ncbi:MAG: hypothetical protein JOZ24_09895 [Candidatus Eremiobacteraeota bacterium]|nr:hypothetical protein [Candidatus Eremiobacteraeota bacterium]
MKASTEQVGPGCNIYAPDGPFVDAQGNLHLRIGQSQGVWTCSEVFLDHSLGYGTYEWTVRGPVDALDTNAVLGLCTYECVPDGEPKRELDIEISRWGIPIDPTNTQYVVQPYNNPGNRVRFTIPPDDIRVRFSWSQEKAVFSTLTAAGSSLGTWTTSVDIPPAGNEQVHMNLWLYCEQDEPPCPEHPPAGNEPVEVVISDFSFFPVRRDAAVTAT